MTYLYAAEEFIKRLNKSMEPKMHFSKLALAPPRRGQRFAKIVYVVKKTNNPAEEFTASSVYAFMNLETGELIKAASWSAPALRPNGTGGGKYFLTTEEGIALAVYNATRSYYGFLYANAPVHQVPK